MSHAEHPDLHRKWRTSLKVTNETGYDTRALRRIIVGAIRAVCLPVRGAVRVTYHRPGEYKNAAWHGGSAAYGRVERKEDGGFITYQGLTMVLTLPRDPALFDLANFARTAHHEALHWKGVDHTEMTDAQLRCSGPVPDWAVGVVVEFRAPKKPDVEELSVRKVRHAQEMLAKARTRAKRASTIEKKWKRKVDGLLRAAAKRVEKASSS